MKVIFFLYLYYTMDFPFVKGFGKIFYFFISGCERAPKCLRKRI